MKRYIIKVNFHGITFYWKKKVLGFSKNLLTTNLQEAAIYEDREECNRKAIQISDSIAYRRAEFYNMDQYVNENTTWSMFKGVEVKKIRLEIVEED